MVTSPDTPPTRRGRPPGPLIVWRLPDAERLAHLDRFRGQRVAVTVNYTRNTGSAALREQIAGRVIGPALTSAGTTASVLVLDVSDVDPGLYALSTATIETIQPL